MKEERALYIGLLALGASLLVGVVCYAAFRPRPLLPIYGGKTVQQWFYGADGHPGRETTMEAARVAFRAMGTNCVPYLVDTLRKPETGSNRFYAWLYPRLPSMLTSKLRPPLSPFYTHKIALWHLRHMVSKLDYVASDLMAIVPQLKDGSTREQAYDTVERLAEISPDVGKKKAYFKTFLSDPNFGIQLRSAVMLSRLDSSFTNGIPILMNAITNKSLVNATFPTPFLTRMPSQATVRQEMAYEALCRVAPSLAASYGTGIAPDAGAQPNASPKAASPRR